MISLTDVFCRSVLSRHAFSGSSVVASPVKMVKEGVFIFEEALISSSNLGTPRVTFLALFPALWNVFLREKKRVENLGLVGRDMSFKSVKKRFRRDVLTESSEWWALPQTARLLFRPFLRALQLIYAIFGVECL